MFHTDPAPTHAPDQPVRILVVEDSRTQAERLRHILQQQDYQVEVTSDGVAALRTLEHFPADLVISDVNMPKMDGYQLARRIKADPALRDTPVILVTNMSDPEDVIRGLECGADNFVIKPFDDRYILGRVRYVLANWEIRSPDDPAMGVGIHFNGQRHFITADRLQILNLLLSTYEAAIQRTRELSASKESLERRSAEISLAHRFLDQVIENIPHGIFVKDATDLRYLRVNRAMEEILDSPRQNLLGHVFGDIYPDCADEVAAREREILAGGPPEATDLQIPTSRGVRIVHVRKLAVLDESGAARYLLGIAEDVTEKKEREAEILRLNAELERRTQEADAANRSKSTFLATMSHEIRTPMNGMSGLLELLALTSLDAEQRALLDAVRESGASLLRIVDDVLDFSKIEAGELAMHPEPVSIRRIVQDVQRTFAAAASKKGLALRAGLDPDLSPVLWVDPLRLRQILANFVSNAIKFTPQGSVEMTAEVVGRENGFERVLLQVRDTGIGISESDRQRLFQPFRQGEAPAVRHAGGTGLGLSICRRLTELMGGSLAMDSELGQGTTMSLELTLRIDSAGAADPAQREPALPALPPLPAVPALPDLAPHSDASGEPPADGPRLLVVDDHPTNRMLLLRQVKTLGYAADAAEHGAEALEMWRSGHYALVVTDCEMPVMDGYALAAAIRSAEASEGRPRTPILACTANALGGGSERCLQAGMDECLVKPIDLRGLQAKLAQWLPPRGAPQAPQPGDGDGQAPAAPLDLSLVQDTWGDDREGVAQALQMFRETNDQDAAALLRAVAVGDAQAAARSSHRIAGASRMIGAEALAASCMRINRAARDADWDEVNAAMAPFESEWRRLNAYLDGLTAGGAASAGGAGS